MAYQFTAVRPEARLSKHSGQSQWSKPGLDYYPIFSFSSFQLSRASQICPLFPCWEFYSSLQETLLRVCLFRGPAGLHHSPLALEKPPTFPNHLLSLSHPQCLNFPDLFLVHPPTLPLTRHTPLQGEDGSNTVFLCHYL